MLTFQTKEGHYHTT